jgi:cytoskeletal protein CcmA (bactofilin family)
MRETSERINGDNTFAEDTIFRGQVNGTATVPSGVRVDLQGQVNGRLRVELGGSVVLRGMVNGDAHNDGTLDIYGVLNGRLIEGESSETRIHPGAVAPRS